MYSVNFKKDWGTRGACAARAELPVDTCPSWRILWFACFKIDKAWRHQYSTFDVGRSMFNVHLFKTSPYGTIAL